MKNVKKLQGVAHMADGISSTMEVNQKRILFCRLPETFFIALRCIEYEFKGPWHRSDCRGNGVGEGGLKG